MTIHQQYRRSEIFSAEQAGVPAPKIRTVAVALFIGFFAASIWSSASAAIGRLAGQPGVSSTGAATYTIPFNVPAGMNGMRPNIALVYDSQSGDGFAGMGWTLSGFSKITRCPLTIATDGRAQGVTHDVQDRFCLDGQPLILVSGTYHWGGSEYRTEVHNYEKITSGGWVGSGPAYFTVQLPDGTINTYGNNSNSRIDAPGSGEVRVWALSSVKDRYDNVIDFTYVEDTINGEFYPNRVRWTYGAGGTPADAPYKLTLSFEERPTAADWRTGYVDGSPWQSKKRLKSVTYWNNDGSGFDRVHKYWLNYTSGSTERSQLLDVTQCGSTDSNCLPTTTFTWQDGADGWTLRSTPSTNIVHEDAVFGDFDGDGDTDIFYPYNGKWNVAMAGSDGLYEAADIIDTGQSHTDDGYPLDFNGDGLTDLLTHGTGSWWVVLESTGSGVTVKNAGITQSAMTNPQPLDMDADGLDDLVYIKNSNAIMFRKNTGAGFGPETNSGIPAQSTYMLIQKDGTVRPADFDGDGRHDLLYARETSGLYEWNAVLSTGNSFDSLVYTFPGGMSSSMNDMILLDENGDGLTDVVRRLTSGVWQTWRSKGQRSSNDMFENRSFSCATPINTTSSDGFFAIDYDGDGRMDLLRPNGNGWRVHTSNEGCFEQGTYVDLPSGTLLAVSVTARIAVVDSNGDGLHDILQAKAPYGFWWKHVEHLGPRGELMTGVTDGLDNIFQPSYKALSSWSGYATDGSEDPPTTRLIRGGPTYVVDQYVSNTGVGSGTYTMTYTYWNAKADMTGRGFLGYEAINAKDSRNNVVTTTNYKQSYPYIGRARLVTVCTGAQWCGEWNPRCGVLPLSLFSGGCAP